MDRISKLPLDSSTTALDVKLGHSCRQIYNIRYYLIIKRSNRPDLMYMFGVGVTNTDGGSLGKDKGIHIAIGIL